jgi:hypothetical protein
MNTLHNNGLLSSTPVTMKFTAALSLIACGSCAAFAPTGQTARTAALSAEMNGWVPDESKFAYGLPGSVSPIKDFDPLGYAERADLVQMKQYRESETVHGRVAMLAVIGFLVTESPVKFHPLFETESKDIGPAIRHLDEVRAAAPFFFEILAVGIGAAEIYRALRGWENPTEVTEKGTVLKDNYFPGDIGFDPLGLKPTDPEAFAKMSTKELQNGRLAMLGIAGFVAQELINGKEVFVNLGLAPDTFDPSTLPIQF